MRVAIATWFPRDPGAPHGGVEAVSVNLVPALARVAGVEVHVVTVDRGVRSPEISECGDVTVHRLPQSSGSLIGFASGAGRRLVQDYLLELKPDIVHSQDTFGMMTRGMDIPRAFTIHGFIHEDTAYGGGLKAKIRSRLWKRAEIATWAEQPHVVSISPYVRERLRGIATGVIHDIENPIDPACYGVVRNERAGTVFCAAAVCRRKNTLGLVKAFSRAARHVSGTRLRLAGPVSEAAYGDAVRRLISAEGLERSVELVGPLPAAEIRGELAEASVFALTSFEEGAPMGVSEAMAAGVPILASNRCGMPYMVRHGETGFLVEPDDPEDIGRHLAELLRDSELRAKLGKSAHKVALERFHPERIAEQSVQLYGRILSGCRNPVSSVAV